jgi:CheY-like chemotaxis protein
MLTGQKVLIVEAEFLIAIDLQRMLEALGAGQVLLAATAREARSFAAEWPSLALAIVDRRLDDTEIGALVTELAGKGIPLVQTTSSSSLRLTPGTGPMLVKPVPEDDLTSAIATALAS